MKPCPLVSMKYMMGRGSWNCTESWSDVEIWIQDVNVDVVIFLMSSSMESVLINLFFTSRVVQK